MRNEAKNKIDYKGYTIEIHYDQDCQNPRTEYDHAAHMVCYHPRYNLGDKAGNGMYYNRETALELYEKVLNRYGKRAHKNVLMMELYLYDHSMLAMRSSKPGEGNPFIGHAHHANWDSSQVGFAYMEGTDIRRYFGVHYITKSIRERAWNVMKAEIKTYGHYLSNECYGYQILNSDNEEIDSCWGFIGEPDGYVLQAAKDVIDRLVKGSKTKPGEVIENV